MAEPGARKTIASILRQDAGTEGAGPRLAQLAWLVFLKALDDRETENEILDERYRSPIPDRLRWRSWAAGDAARSGDDLLHFIDAELIPGLAGLPPHRGEAGAVVRDASRVVADHARSGPLLRRAIERLSQVDFNSLPARRSFQDELALAVSEAGEPFVPPALARFIVEALDPELGEAVLDPSCKAGTLLTAVVERVRDRWVRSPRCGASAKGRSRKRRRSGATAPSSTR